MKYILHYPSGTAVPNINDNKNYVRCSTCKRIIHLNKPIKKYKSGLTDIAIRCEYDQLRYGNYNDKDIINHDQPTIQHIIEWDDDPEKYIVNANKYTL